MWINGEEGDVEALDAGKLEQELLAEQHQVSSLLSRRPSTGVMALTNEMA